jgi:hypothetical protein
MFYVNSVTELGDLLSIILGEQTNPLGGIKNIILSINKYLTIVRSSDVGIRTLHVYGLC